MKKLKTSKIKKPAIFEVSGTQTIPPLDGLPVNPYIPTHHVDLVNVMSSNDGFALIRFFSRTPGLNLEECRISCSHTLTKKIVDLICKHLDYYPERPPQ